MIKARRGGFWTCVYDFIEPAGKYVSLHFWNQAMKYAGKGLGRGEANSYPTLLGTL